MLVDNSDFPQIIAMYSEKNGIKLIMNLASKSKACFTNFFLQFATIFQNINFFDFQWQFKYIFKMCNPPIL